MAPYSIDTSNTICVGSGCMACETPAKKDNDARRPAVVSSRSVRTSNFAK